MTAEKFKITATKSGTRAEIRIIGTIGWETDSETFRAQIDNLVKEGIRDAHLYIHSPGGNCFDAAEIVNILAKFKGDVTGEGGSLTASAATYIALHCRTFSMPENGMFMVHKPSGGAYGSAADIEAYLKLMKDTEKQYYDTYKAVVKNPTSFDEKWNSGDWWMTAREAKEQGFITEISAKTKITREAQAQLKACGCPFEIEINDDLKGKEMDLKTTALLLGLPETATEEEVKEKLRANAKASADLTALLTAQAERRKTERAAKIKTALDKAVAEKRIKADARAAWEKMMNDDLETAEAALSAIAPLEKPSSKIDKSPEGKKTFRGKTFAELQDENPEALADLEKENPEVFADLFNETFGGKGGRI